MGDRVHLVGYLERRELKCLLHACRVFTMPSVEESETFGIAQVEAMACGKPIVNTRLLTGVPWVARDGIEAVTVPPEIAGRPGRSAHPRARPRGRGRRHGCLRPATRRNHLQLRHIPQRDIESLQRHGKGEEGILNHRFERHIGFD